jgi:hypothetical protein
LQGDDPILKAALERILQRASHVTKRQDRVDQVERMLKHAKDVWLSKTHGQGSQLTYSTRRGDQVNLLVAPQASADRQVFTCLNSMRDVELPVRLILDDAHMDVTP